MIITKYYIYGEYVKTIKFSDNDFTRMLKYSHENASGRWYRDAGLGVYLIKGG